MHKFSLTTTKQPLTDEITAKHGNKHITAFFFSREELERFAHNGTLSHLIVCFSRDEPDEVGTVNRPTYVQHNLLLHAKNVASILLKDKGCLYVCGWVQNTIFHHLLLSSAILFTRNKTISHNFTGMPRTWQKM